MMTFEAWFDATFGTDGPTAVEYVLKRSVARQAWAAATAAERERCAKVAENCCASLDPIEVAAAIRESPAPADGGKDADSYKLNPGGQRA